MTLPVHDIDYVKASHRKYQFITIFFTIVTLAATLGAAFSGIQLSNLRQERLDSKEEVAPEPSPPKAPAIADDAAMKEIEALKAELAQEKSSALKMKAKIKNLHNQISALEKAVEASRAPKPKAAPAPQSLKPEPAQKPQPKPATPDLPLQKKQPVATVGPQPHQKAASPPEPASESNKRETPSASAPHPSESSVGGVAPQPAPASPPVRPAKEAVTPSVDATAKPQPAPEAEQPDAAPQVVAPPSQPQTATDQPAPINAGEPEGKANP
jgi:hypothetical protein